MTAARAGHGAAKVLGVEVRPDGDDGHELFVRGEAPDPVRYPAYEITVRVALAGPVEQSETETGTPEDPARWSGCLPADRRRGAKRRGGLDGGRGDGA